jgi:hypothetical protein
MDLTMVYTTSAESTHPGVSVYIAVVTRHGLSSG